MRRVAALLLVAGFAVALTGCVTVQPKDYTEFRKSRPRSILILPPLNQTTDVLASYSVLTTVTRPTAEQGYYVFPVVMVDQMMKENGLTNPAEMQQAPLQKLREVFGADAVLYLTVDQYGSKYQLFASTVIVHLRGRLVDARTGVLLWEGTARMENSGQSGLIEALVTQVLNKMTDAAHPTAIMASLQLLTPKGQGLLRGPYHPEHGTD